MTLRKNFSGRREARRIDATTRAEVRSKRSAAQQLEHLDKLFGAGLGAKKERERLQKLLVSK